MVTGSRYQEVKAKGESKFTERQRGEIDRVVLDAEPVYSTSVTEVDGRVLGITSVSVGNTSLNKVSHYSHEDNRWYIDYSVSVDGNIVEFSDFAPALRAFRDSL